MRPWDIIGNTEERTLIPANWLASTFYGIARGAERAIPRLSVKLWQYPIVILDKLW